MKSDLKYTLAFCMIMFVLGQAANHTVTFTDTDMTVDFTPFDTRSSSAYFMEFDLTVNLTEWQNSQRYAFACTQADSEYAFTDNNFAWYIAAVCSTMFGNWDSDGISGTRLVFQSQLGTMQQNPVAFTSTSSPSAGVISSSTITESDRYIHTFNVYVGDGSSCGSNVPCDFAELNYACIRTVGVQSNPSMDSSNSYITLENVYFGETPVEVPDTGSNSDTNDVGGETSSGQTINATKAAIFAIGLWLNF